MSAARPYIICPKCGKDAERQVLDSFIRHLYVCPNGHTTVTLVNRLTGTEQVLSP